jgi:hypothetical protein
MWLGTRTDLFVFTIVARDSFAWRAMKITLFALNAAIVCLGAAFGLYALVRRRGERVLFVPVLYALLVYFPFRNAETRFSQPVLPLLTLLALTALLERRSARADTAPARTAP